MHKTFLQCVSEYRKSHGIKGGKAPAKGTKEYKAVKAMMGPEKEKPVKAKKASKKHMMAESVVMM